MYQRSLPSSLPLYNLLLVGGEGKDSEIKPELQFLNKETRVSEPIFPSQFKGKCLHSNDKLL